MADTDALEIHVISHTHWDREWYHPAGRFRQRLVALIDELLDDPPPDGESFLLDGQAIVLDDYLSVRPERRDELASLLRERRLEAGPWYVLADELIPSGEALVRNLLAGHASLRALGAEPPAVLYCPDSFGHAAALPVVAREFGASLAIVWRGYGGRRWPAGDTARWRAPGGAEVLLHHLPPDGYEFGSSLPVDEGEARARWAAMRGVLARRSTLGLLLVQNGADHHARQRRHRQALDALELAARPATLVRGSLSAFASALVARARGRELPLVTGELRDSYGYTWALQGTFASRAAQKRRNAHVERLLLRDAEPWAAIAAHGALRKVDRGPLLRAAWRTVLDCHPHDTLCGCSIDAVARAMDVRLSDAEAQGRGIRDDALLDIIGHDPVHARDQQRHWVNAVVVRNAAARPRAGVAELTVSTFLHDVRVGPGSGEHNPGTGAVSTSRGHRSHAARARPALLADAPNLLDGDRPIATQQLGRRNAVELTESPRHYPDADAVVVSRMLAWVGDVHGYGTHSFRVEGGNPTGDSVRAIVPNGGALPAGVEPARGGSRYIDNGLLRVQWTARGDVEVSTRDGRRVTRLLGIEDQDDLGDLYTPSPRGAVRRGKFSRARASRSGPLRAEMETTWRLANGDALVVRLSLDAGANWLRLHVAGTNTARDHRLRVVIATDIARPVVWADAAFGPVRRNAIVVPEEDTRAELPPSTAPLQRYVSLFDEQKGATIFSDGLAEYDARDDGSVAITLLRAVGELSRNDLPERPGHAGWPAPVPGAQSLGAHRAAFALLLHGPRSVASLGEIERTADDVLLPMRGRSLRSALAIPPSTSGIELSGDGLAFSSCKPSDQGAWMVLRCINHTDEERTAVWQLSWPPSAVHHATMDETPGAGIVPDGNAIRVAVAGRSVSTILVR